METIKEELLADPKEVIREDLKFLREYARRILLEEDDALVAIEDFKDILNAGVPGRGQVPQVDRAGYDGALVPGHTGQMLLGAIIPPRFDWAIYYRRGRPRVF
jgi:hypothetical protein